MDPRLQVNWYFILHGKGLSRQETIESNFLAGLLHELERNVKNFESALAIFDLWYANGKPGHYWENPYAGWGGVAARDAAMTVYHFGDAMEAAKEVIRRQLPMLNARINWKVVKGIIRDFRQQFPHHEHLRDAVAHASAQAKNREMRSRNSIERRLMYPPGIQDKTFRITHKGMVVSLEISRESLAGLASLRSRFWDVVKMA